MNLTFMLLFVVPVVAGAIILLAGAVFLIIDARRNKKSSEVETQDWETTGGKIIACRLEERAAASGANAEAKFEPVIEYVYTVKQAEYRSNKVFPGENITFSKKQAQEILDEHPLNMYVPVKYNPQDPNMSSLENRPAGTNYIQVAGLVLTSFGMLVCCFATFMTLLATGKY